MVLKFGFLQNEQRHILTEQLAHGLHAAEPCVHIVNLVAHRHEDCLHTASARRVVQFGVAVGDVAHADKCQRLLHIVKCLLEAVQSADLAKGEFFTLCQAVGCGEIFKELGRTPAIIGIIVYISLQL